MQQLDELLNSWLDNELMSDGKNKQHLAGWLKTNHNRLGSEWRIWWLWWVWWVWRVWYLKLGCQWANQAINVQLRHLQLPPWAVNLLALSSTLTNCHQELHVCM